MSQLPHRVQLGVQLLFHLTAYSVEFKATHLFDSARVKRPSEHTARHVTGCWRASCVNHIASAYESDNARKDGIG